MRLWLHVLSLELRKIVTYRVDFWFRFVGTLLANVVVAYFLWSAVFARTGAAAIRGFTFEALILYYVLAPLAENVARPVDGGAIAEEIYSGGLTKFLVYPASFFRFKYVAHVAGALMAIFQLAFVLGGYALWHGIPAEVPLTFWTVLMGIAFALCAGILNYLIGAAVDQVAFWADRVWSLNVMVMFITRILGGSLLPLAMFPETMQTAVKWTPFPYLIAFPVQAMMGQVGLADLPQAFLVMGLWCGALLLANRALWKAGSLKYTGVGI